jgi:hypothetical protein
VAPGRNGFEIAVNGSEIAVNAVCDGTGTLLIVASATAAVDAAVAVPAAVFLCSPEAAPARVTLAGLQPGSVTFTSYVVEGPGAQDPSVYSVSIEQPD